MPESKKDERIGEKRMANCGMEMEIIAYRNSHDIDVRFANGRIAEHKYYVDFREGLISMPLPNRIGEKRKANNGMEMEIIAYRHSEDIDIRFENGAVAYHRKYAKFCTGEVAPPKESRIGERRKANCGLEMEIIAYRNSSDIDVRFPDETIAEHVSYGAFKRGQLAPPKPERIGEKRKANNGLMMEIIAYRNAHNIDVRFENGAVAKHKRYNLFTRGQIPLPKPDRVGEARKANNGLEMTIIAYRNSHDIDVRFENGTVAEHKTYGRFLAGEIAIPQPNHIGEKNLASNGMQMEIIAYRGADDIDVRFEDDSVTTHKAYASFRDGSIAPPQRDRVEEQNISNCGLRMRIVAYRRSTDIDIQFEDGTILEHRAYSAFLSKQITSPYLWRKENAVYHGVRVKRAFQDGDKTYYDCTFPDGTKDICTPQEIMERQGIKPVF